MSHSQTVPATAVPQRILVVDDEDRIVRFVARRLAEAGYEVCVALGGGEALKVVRSRSCDLVILDLLMPDIDGISVLRELMLQQPDQPVIILSCLTDTDSKVRCLGLGASDFVAKPFFFEELLARVRAQLRTAARGATTHVEVGCISLDLERQAADVGTGPVSLTQREFHLLRELIRHGGTTVSRERLLSAVWGLDFDPGSNVVEVSVGRLRAKLGNEVVETVRREGYRVAVG